MLGKAEYIARDLEPQLDTRNTRLNSILGNPLNLAMRFGHVETVAYLIDPGTRPHIAVRKIDVRRAIEACCDGDGMDEGFLGVDAGSGKGEWRGKGKAREEDGAETRKSKIGISMLQVLLRQWVADQRHERRTLYKDRVQTDIWDQPKEWSEYEEFLTLAATKGANEAAEVIERIMT